MYLLLFTLVYCVVAYVLNISYIIVAFIYTFGFAAIKGWFSAELKDVFNLEDTKYLYEKNGMNASFMEFLSLTLIFYIYAFFFNPEDDPIYPLDYIIGLFLLVIVYRFLFWGITRTIGKIFKLP